MLSARVLLMHGGKCNIMKRHFTIALTLLIISMFLFSTSCTKNQVQTLSSNLLGNWRKTAYATDDNGAGFITPSEIYPQSPEIVEILSLEKDGTGFDSTIVNGNLSTKTVLPLHWSVYGDSLTIAYDAHDTNTYYVENVNSKNLALYKPTVNGLAAYYYNR